MSVITFLATERQEASKNYSTFAIVVKWPDVWLSRIRRLKNGMIGKWILVFGVVLVVVGALVWLVESLGLPLGRLPGDIRMRGEGWSFSFPIVTCIIVSFALTVVLNLLLWFFRR